MNREETIQKIKECIPELQADYEVKSVKLFGSITGKNFNEESDVDIIIKFRRPATLKRYFEVKELLESELKREVDLAMKKMMRPEIMK